MKNKNNNNYIITFTDDSFCMLFKNIKNSISANLYDLKDFFVVMDAVNDVLENYKKQIFKNILNNLIR